MCTELSKQTKCPLVLILAVSVRYHIYKKKILNTVYLREKFVSRPGFEPGTSALRAGVQIY